VQIENSKVRARLRPNDVRSDAAMPEKNERIFREEQLIAFAELGLTDKQMAQRLDLSEDTIGTYWRNICERYGVKSRNQVLGIIRGNVQEALERMFLFVNAGSTGILVLDAEDNVFCFNSAFTRMFQIPECGDGSQLSVQFLRKVTEVGRQVTRKPHPLLGHKLNDSQALDNRYAYIKTLLLCLEEDQKEIASGETHEKEMVVPGNRIVRREFIRHAGMRCSIWFFEDVTEDRRLELDHLAMLEMIFPHHYHVDSKWRITSISGPAQELLGLDPTAVGRRIWDVRKNTFNTNVGRLVRRAMSQRKRHNWYGIHVPLGGDKFTIVAMPTSKDNGLSVYFADRRIVFPKFKVKSV
jgi:DNA-binding CsgD family transcriptional regulator